MKIGDIQKEVSAIVEAKIDAREVVRSTWLIHEVIGRHQLPECNESAWFFCCAREALAKVVRDVVQSYKPSKDDPDPQMVFPGFERLQRGYLVTRDGEQAVVCTLDLTDVEIDAKAADLQRMGIGCFRHRDELLRFKTERVTSAAG